jgi:hypothetical protein
MGLVARWAAVAAVAAGVWVSGAREAKGANWGFYNDDRSWVVIEVEGNQSPYSLWNTTCGTFNGAFLGGVAQGGSLKIVSYDTKTWKSGGDVTGCQYWYKIDSGTAVSMGGGYISSLGGNNQKWGNSSVNANVAAGLAPGSHTLTIYGKITGTGDPNGDQWDSNGGDNYTATFYVFGPTEIGETSVKIGGAGASYRVWAGKMDVLDYAAVGGSSLNNSTTPSDWTATGSESGASYAGRSRRRGTVAYDLTHYTSGGTTIANNSGGLWTTASGGTIRRVIVDWAEDYNQATASTARDIDIYGRAAAYAIGNVVGTSYTGTKLGRLVRAVGAGAPNVEFVVDASYTYANISGGSALNGRLVSVTSISFEWEKAGATSTAAGWPITLTGLTPDTTYTWGVASGTNLIASGTFTTAAPATEPPTVDDPTATVTGTETATVGATVTDDGGDTVTEYGVVIGTSANPTTAAGGYVKKYSTSADPGSTPFTFNATGLSAGTTYHYRGYAVNGEGTGYTDDATFTTLANQTVTVGNLSFSYGGAAKALTVTAPGSGTKHYSSSDTSVATVDASGNVTPHAVGTATITVTVDADGTYAAGSGTGTVTVNAVVPTLTTPTSASVGTTTATLGATVTGNGGVALTGGGVVYSSTATTPTVGGSGCTSTSLASAPTVNTPFTKAVSSLTPGTKYYYRGWAQNGSASGYGYSAVGNFTTKCLAPSAASSLSATANSSSKITLGWTAATANPGSGGSVKYLVLQTTDPNAPAFTPVNGTAYSTDATVGEGGVWTVKVGAGTSTSPSYTGLSSDTTYYYAVYAYQIVGTDASTIAYAAGVTANATTQTDAPAAWTSNVSCDSVGGKRATLSWDANSGGCAGYMVVVREGGTAPGNTIYTQGRIYVVDEEIASGAVVKYVGANHSSVTISGLKGNQKYSVKVYAYNGNKYRAYVSGSSSTQFTTADVTGPKVWVTGVDTNSFLVNWAETANTGGYLAEVQDGSGNTAGAFASSFTLAEGWGTSTGSDGTGPLTIGTAVGSDNDKWYINSVRRYSDSSSTVQGETEYGYLYLTAGGSYVTTPVLPGDVTELRVKWRNGGGSRTLRIDVVNPDLSVATSGVTSWVNSTANGSAISVYNTATISTKGKRLRFYNNSGSSATLYLHHIAMTMKGVQGHSAQVNGLSDGTAYTALVSALPDGEAGEATATTGVVPGAPSATELRNKVTFTWAAASGASGYMVDATLTNVAATGASWTTKSPEASALSFVNAANWGGKTWCFTNANNATQTASSGGDGTRVVPCYNSTYGYFLTGVAGNTLMSTNFPIGGATDISLGFTVGAWNLNNTYGGIEVGRVYAYYKLDDGPWCYLGTSIPTAVAESGAEATFLASVPQGALDGTNIAFKITAPNARTGNNYNRGPVLKKGTVVVTRTMPATTADYGYYGTNSLSGYPQVVNGTSHTVTVGGSGTSVYFRVQALQGSTSDPTARSIWKAAKGTTAAYTAPGTPAGSGITRNSMTVSWTAGNTTDLSKYVLEVSTSSGFPSGSTTSYNVTGGATSQALTGLAGNTTYYFRVKAEGTDSQESAWSGTGNAKTENFDAPENLRVTAGPTRNGMTWSWDDIGESGETYGWALTGCKTAATEVDVGTASPGESLPYPATAAAVTEPHTAEGWSYRHGWTSSKGYAAGSYPQWHSSYGHLLVGQYSGQTYKPGIETPPVDLSDAESARVKFDYRYLNYGQVQGTADKSAWSVLTLYYSLDGGATWTAGPTSAKAPTDKSWSNNQYLAVPAEALGHANVRLQLRADKAQAYSPGGTWTGDDAFVAGAGVRNVQVRKVPTGGDYDPSCAQGYQSGTTAADVTSVALTGLNPDQVYYFKVWAISGGQTSDETEGTAKTTPFAGPTGLAITDTGRYTLTAGWDAYAESGYTTQYEVQLTPCANAGAEAATAGACPAQNLAFGTSATDWTYQREYSGTTACAYPKYENGVHKLWGQKAVTTTEPGILSPELDLAGYVSANVEFSHMYVNRANMSEVALYYSLDEGANWTLVQETGEAAGATAATASSRSIPLPADALAGGVKLLLRTKHATNYDLNPPNEDWRAQGASIANLKVTARGVGGGDYECGTATAIQGPQSSTSKPFNGLSAGGEYYIRVRTVLTPVGGGAAERSAWTEIPASTAVPQPPPEEIWGESIRQNHMTVAWSEAPGATAGTLYKYEVTKCAGATSTEVAAQETRTDGDLEEGVDDWTYTGGGTVPEATQQTTYGFLRETYPAWARLSENTIVLAGAGSPGIESIEFSTVGASAGTVTFLHGRWYDAGDLSFAAVTLSYSIDGGDSWTDGPVQSASDISTGSATYSRSLALPAGALGHAHVKVRLEARAAADSGAGTSKPVGAAIQKAKVTLTKQGGDYSGSGCVISSGTGLTADQLSAELEELEAGHPYYFHVAASDGVLVGGAPQYGAWTESMATTKSAPAAPASAWVVPESIGRHAMTVQWDAVADAETYVVKVYQGSSASGTPLQTIETASTSLTVTGLEAQRQYYYTIQSKADGESSSGTANCTGTTSASLAVTGFCVTNILDTSLSVKWDNVADTAYTLEVGPMTTDGATGALYETIECPATTLARSDKGNGWFYLGGNANYPKYYVKSSGTAAQKAEDQGHVLSYSSAGAPGIQSRWFSTFGAKSATIEFLHGRWFNDGKNSALQVFYSIDGGTTWTLAGDIASTANAVPGSSAAGGEKTWTRFALPERALGQRTVAIRVQAPDAAAGGSYGYGAEIKDLRIKLEAYPQSASTFSGTVSGGIQNLSGLAIGRRYWFRLTATETYNSQTFTAEAVQTAATRQKTAGVVQSQGFEGAGENGALDTTAWGYDIKYNVVGTTTWRTESQRLSTDPEVKVVDGENPMYGDRALRMSGSAAAGTYGVVEFANKDFGAGHSENVVVTIPFAACDLAEGENLWVSYSTDGGTAWVAPEGLATLTKGGWTMGKIGRGGGDVMNQNWPYNRGTNSTTRPAGDAYSFELHGIRQLAVRVAFCGNSGGAKHYCYIDEVKLERLATPPTDVTASANTHGTVDLGWTPAGGQSVVVIRGQDMRNPPASLDLNSLPHGYEVVTNDAGGNYWVNTADPGVHATATDPGVTGGWKYFYYFYGALDNGDGTYTLSKECVQKEVIVRGMVEAIASQGWDGWDVHPWGYKKGRTTNPGRAGDCGYWAYNQSGDTLPYEWAHFVEGSWEYDGQTGRNTSKGVVPSGVKDYAYYYGAGKTYGPAGRTDPDCTNQLGVSSYTNYFGTNCFRLSGGSGWTWYGSHTWTNNEGQVKTGTDIVINTNNPAIQFDTIDLSGYKNVEFSFHYAQTYSGGGNYMHVAISTNGNGADGTWMSYDNKNDGMWRQRTDTSRDYGLQLQTMTGDFSGGNVDFYDESRAPYGNPFVLQVPDAVTQLTVRLTFFDTTAVDQRKALIFVDEVRLTGEVAIEAPKPYISEIGKNQFMVHWEPVADATTYDVEVTEVCDESKIKLAQAFVVDGCPKDWEASSSGATFTKTASRLYASVSGTAHDHGLNLSGGSGALTSPEVGGTTNLQFYAKAYNASGSAKLIVEAKGDKDTEWEEIGSWTAAQLTGSWKGYTNSLPNRQWTQVRFRREGGSGTSDSIYVDDIEFHGEGVYTVAGVKSFTGVSATNQVVTGLTSGKRYLAHVRAVGAPAGVVVRSAWGETADWTAGDFAVAADGFEMTRSTWGNPGSGIAVIAVNEGKAYSDVPAPTGTPAVGTAVGQGVVIVRTTSAQTGAGFEHVVPYGERTDAVDQKYVVYWKHGSYWEGRLETNVTLGIYRSIAADAIAVTNATADSNVGTYSAAEGKGWASGWNLWDSADGNIDIVRESSWPYGLVGSNKLYGAGGNMVRFDMSNDTRRVRIHRSLASNEVSDVVWMMVTVRSEYGGTAETEDDGTTMKKMFGVQLTSIGDAATAGQGIFASVGNLARRYSNKPMLQIDTSDNSSWPGGTAITWDNNGSGYELKDTGNQGGGAHTIVIKYDMGANPRTLSAAAIYTPNVQTIANNGALSPNSSAPTFNCSTTISGSPELAGIILMGKGYNGKLEFDEVRVGKSWGALVGKEPVAPFPVSTATATMDGKEMIRLAWTKPAEATDTTVVPNVLRPAAEQVIVLEKNLNTAFTADQLAWKTHTQGDSSTIGDAVVRVVYRGSGTEIEHVVLPGTSHRYAFYSYAEGVYAASALEVSTDSVTGNALTMDRYGETEYVNPFSYTNSFEVSGSGTHTEWRGGNGFTNAGGNTVHFWATGDGQNGTTANAATWTPVKPADAPAKMGTEIPNYKASAGNVMKVSPSGNTSASLGRTLAQDWGGEAGKTFYIAYRMAYTYDGVNKWAGLKLIDNSGSHRGVFVGKPGTSDSSKQNLLSIDPGGGLGIGFGNYSLNAGAGNAYVVVAKVQWTAADKVNVYAMAKYADGETEFPEEEPATGWNAQWINMTFSGVHMIELLAGGTGSDVTPGDTYFDEIRFGGSWDDLLGPKVPTDVWMAGLSEDVFLGDYVVNNITSKPQGPGQSAKHLLSGADEPSGAAWAAGVDAAWVRNITTETPPQTEWIATNQFKTTGTLYAYGSATGDGETVYSWQHGNSTYRKNTYTVSALPAPTLTATSDVGYKVPLSWTRGTSGGRTFEEVMIVRYSSRYAAETISANNLKPVDGTAYFAGDVISHSNPEHYMTVIYRGTATGYTNRPCSNGTTYYYAAYTVNNSYYSERATANATPSGDGGEITVDGDPTDWVGTPAEPWNSSIFSEGELIWTDKRGEERTDVPERCPSADITEFRVKADSTNVYFLLQLNGGTATMPTNAHIAVGLDTRLSTESTDMNWLADESYTFLGGAYYTNSPAFHYPKIQMGVHWVGGDRNEWQVELYDTDSASWHAPSWWKASSALNGDGEPITTDTPCVEWVVPRSELGLAGVTGSAAVTGRFSVATFLNSGAWNNEAAGVVRIEDNSCAAVDALAIAPYGSNDKDYALGAWDEGLKNNNVDFWMDARFGAAALLADTAPSTPANPEPANDLTGAGNPTLQWSNSTDAEGFVTGWLLEVADTPNFGGDGGHTENGSVLYRVNVEMTEALAAALAADSSRKISFKPMTNCKEFWWRVRARDNAGQLSAATVQHYTVTGKQDNDGPVATLKYVGSQVGRFLGDSEYRAEVERNGEAYSILDSEFGGSSAEFGFVIEWYDINGVYATNHMRAWVTEYDGTKETGPSAWPPWNPNVGDYAWNVLATNSDGTVYGRVSPNWDLMMVNTNRAADNPPSPRSITVHIADGKTKTLTWEHWGASSDEHKELLIPDAMGEYQPAEGWVIQWGYDDAFQGVGTESGTTFPGQTLRAYDERGTEISCNGVQYLTNFVSGVFGLPEYDPEVDLYLTLSAEDCCTSDQWGEQPWDPWPPSNERDHQGSYRGLSANEYPGEAYENVLTGGWCADGPNPARNVTVNQLIKINVRDNDVVPPIASAERWAASAVDEDGTEFKPSLLVSTNTIAASSANTTWAAIEGKLPRREGLQRDVMYQLTDAMMAGGTRPLSFFFNVYDDYIESGTQRGTAATTPNTGNTRSLTNSAFVVKTWDPALNEGAGAWVASAENTANFVAGGSYISDIVHDGTGWHEAAGTKGTGPSTVLRWDFATSDINSLFGMTDILSYIGTHSDGVTNVVQLHAWDSDDNRAGDQADAEITFGRLLFSDDDATSPEAASFTLLGTGTNMVKFGEVAKEVWTAGPAGPTATFTGMRMGTAQVNESSAITVHAKGADGATGSASLNWSGADNVAYMSSAMTGTDHTANSKYFEWALTGTAGARWLVDTLTFKNVVSAQGPTMYALTVQDGTTRTEDYVPSSATPWRNHGAGNKDSDHVSATSANVYENKNYTQAYLRTPAISMTGVSSGSVTFDAGPYTAVGSQTLKLQAYLNYNAAAEDASKWTDVPGASWTASTIGKTYSAGGKVTGDFAFSAITVQTESGTKPLLECTEAGNTVTFRWLVTKASADGQRGFTVGSPKVTTTVGRVTETLLETIRVDKNEGSSGDGTYAKTESQISIPFAAQENLGTGVKTFRLYGFRATSSMQNEEAVTAGTAEPDGSGNWGINDLTMQGILSGPKGVEVTDQDVDLGSWTNQVEVMDSIKTGYDTDRSGLWMQDDGGSYPQKVPSFTILYPESLGGGLGGTEFWSSDFDVDKYAVADLTAGANRDFTALPAGTGWMLTGATVETGTTASGKILSLAGGDSTAGSASQSFAISEPEGGLASASVQVTARVRSVLAATDPLHENHFVLKAEFKNAGGTVLKTETETFDANHGWKDYTLGPVSLENSLVREIVVTIAEAGTDGTGLEVDSVDISVGVYAPMSDGTPANGVLGARLMLGTPAVPASVLSTKSMPLSEDETAGWKYGMVAKVYDYDHDRTDDALDTGAVNAFRLYDDDEEPPQWGRQFGGPFGVSVNGAPLLSKYRIANGGGTNMVWTLSDHALAEAAGSGAAATIGFHLDFYDYSGWRVTQLQFQKLNGSGAASGAPETVLSGGTMAAAGTLASGYSRTTGDDSGAANTPSATVGWTRSVSDFYEANKSAYLSDGNVTNAVNAWVTDVDNDRLDDSLTTNNVAVGNFRLLDQDQLAPYFRPAQGASETPKFRAVMVATNVPGYAELTSQATDAAAPYALGGYALHQGPTADVASRTLPDLYDSQLLASLLNGNHFVVSADIVDRGENGVGRSNTGLRRGTTKTTTGVTSALEDEAFTLNNSYLALVSGDDTVTLEGAYAAGWGSSDLETKMASQTRYSSWVWPTNGGTRATATNEVGQWLPSDASSKAWTLQFNVWDNDMDRDGDQMGAVLTGPVLTIRDDDTQAPSAPSAVKINGETVVAGSVTRETAPWTNDLSSIQVAWTASVDPEPTGTDIKKAGVGGYRLASHDAAIGPDAGSALTQTTTNGTTVSKALSGVTMEQGWDTYKLFAVDADADRPGDALASTAADLPLAYDITKPTAVAPNGSATGSGNRLVADPDNTDDPTTQFDLTWPIDGIGPDDPSDKTNYDAIPAKYKAAGVKVSDQEILSPWMTYKVYYTTFEESDVPSTDNPNSQEKSWVYQQHILTEAYKTWPSVVATSTATDPTAAANPYDSLKAVTANAGSGKQTVRLYDLDFDQHYMVIVVGVDKAGNEGPAGMWSWATNNTIKFAVTQGVVKASAAINSEVGDLVSGQATNTVGMAKITGDNAPAKAAVLYWMAAGQHEDPQTHQRTGNVNKLYDLIYRDAPSFSEAGTEQWSMAATDDNTGTSKTNWNYQADAGLGTPGRVRFYRASYTGRWQDTKPGTSEKQFPLASEEVYSMNNIVLSEGWNYVSLQGVPWTNTFRGVFGTDTSMWPAAGTTAADSANATRIEFYQPGTNAVVREWFFLGKDGEWYASGGTKVTDTLQTDGFFARPFGIVLPTAVTNAEGGVESGWWKDHADYDGAKASASRSVRAMMWHPILQVPTNAPAGGYSQTVTRGKGTYNLLSLNLPVAVHPSKLGLVEIDSTTGKPTTDASKMKMRTGAAPEADKLYVVDTQTKEVRGNSMVYCDDAGNWKFVVGGWAVPGDYIRPNDMVVLISGERKTGDENTWTWTYTPEQFYDLPDRHMGRTQSQNGAGE